MHLAFHYIQTNICPMVVAPANQLLRYLAKLLEREPMLLHQNGNGTKSNDVLEGIHTTVGRMSILIGISGLEKAGPIPGAKLTVRQPGEACHMIFAKRCN